MEAEVVKECSKGDNGVIKACSSLQRSMDGYTMRFLPLRNREGVLVDELAILHSGNAERKRKGVVLNFCPFCGSESISQRKAQQCP